MNLMKKLSTGSLGLLLLGLSSSGIAADNGMLDNAISNNSAQANLTNQLNSQLANPYGANNPQLGGMNQAPQGLPVAANVNTNQAIPAFNPSPSAPLAPAPPVQPTMAMPNPVVPNGGVAEQAFSNMARGLMPLSPDQIQMLHYLFDQSRKAAAASATTPPKPTSSSVSVNLAPGATPPVIRLAAGFVTSMVFLDGTGAPWPIHSYDLGDPKGFSIQWDKKSNTLLVQAMNEYKSANLAVVLEGLNTPVMITLLPGQQAVDYRVDLRVPGLGPNATPAIEDMPGTGDPQLLSVLDGIPPQGAKELTISGGECQGWMTNDGHIFLRTRLTLLSPSWITLVTSADGMHAYEIEKTPVVLASARGKMVQLSLQGL